MAFTLITCNRTFEVAGQPVSGSGFVQLSSAMSDSGAPSATVSTEQIPVTVNAAGQLVGPLGRRGSGGIGVLLEATDQSTTQPTGVVWTLAVTLDGQQQPALSFSVPHAAPGGILDLDTVTPAQPVTPSFTPVSTIVNSDGTVTVSQVGTQVTLSSPRVDWLFSDGADGAVNFNGTNTYPGLATLVGSTYTLTRHVYGTTIVVAPGVTVETLGWYLLATTSITNNGTIDASGLSATSLTGAAKFGVLVIANGGGNGATGNGTAGGAQGLETALGGAGGAGSTGTAGGGGASSTGWSAWVHRPPYILFTGCFSSNGAVRTAGAGCGGGGGGGDGTNAGGGGGGGGGLIVLAAPVVTNTGTISANGGNGFTPTTGNCGGGGGGGAGGIIIYSAVPWTNTGTTSTAHGTPGSGVGTGAAGLAGGNALFAFPANVILS